MSTELSEIPQQDLRSFIREANINTYAAGSSDEWEHRPDGATVIRYTSGDFSYHDEFYGGEPYGGRIVISFKDVGVWMMGYYGWVNTGYNQEKVYKFLRDALKKAPEDKPFRGPAEYIDGEWVYTNQLEGDLDRLQLEETITFQGKEVYKAKYMGGFVDIE